LRFGTSRRASMGAGVGLGAACCLAYSSGGRGYGVLVPVSVFPRARRVRALRRTSDEGIMRGDNHELASSGEI
jgi:hypothetical protein